MNENLSGKPFGLAAFLLIVLLASSGLWGQTIKIEGRTMGPVKYTVVLDPVPQGADQQEIARQIQSELDLVNQSMSTYIDESEISRFNRSSSTDWFEVSLPTAQVVQRSLEISEQTGGAFDITIGPLVELWKFGTDKSAFQIPSDERIAQALKQVGYQKMAVRFDPPAIKKSQASIQIDLSAIAKGYAVDRVATKLNELKIPHYMVEVGGEVRTRGNKSDGSAWKIGIEVPDATQVGQYRHRVELKDQSMATSGDYRNFYEFDGKTYSHTIDPATGRPVTHALASLSVIASDCMSADAYATAGLVLGPEKLKQVFDRLEISYFSLSKQADSFVENASSRFPVLGNVPDETTSKEAGSSIIPMFVGAAVIFGLAILGMAFGAIFNNKPITGSCGGLSAKNNPDGSSSCSLCQKPVSECPDKKADAEAASVE